MPDARQLTRLRTPECDYQNTDTHDNHTSGIEHEDRQAQAHAWAQAAQRALPTGPSMEDTPMSDARDAPEPDAPEPDADAGPDRDPDPEADAQSASESDGTTETGDVAVVDADGRPTSDEVASSGENDAESATKPGADVEVDTPVDGPEDAEPEPKPASPSPSDDPAETDTDPSDERLPDPDDKEWCQETVDQATRQSVLENDKHRCQFCGATGPGEGGQATLQVHHIERDPDHCDLHDEENLTTLCEGCHSWMHKRPTVDDAPVDLTEGDEEVLLPHDYEILRVLAMRGPATVGDITDHLYPSHSTMAVRERLWTLMALDNIVETRETQLVDQDPYTNEWALLRPGRDSPIERSARGHIPEDPDERQTRVEDELVRQALRQGCDRQAVADAFGVTYRTTWHKQRRAQAYDISLGAVTGKSGQSGVPEQGAGEAD